MAIIWDNNFKAKQAEEPPKVEVVKQEDKENADQDKQEEKPRASFKWSP